jgi:chromosome condensin MukBEF ATPase and DNA-binding subunit MukB
MQAASTEEHAVAIDKEEAEQLHREALHSIVHDIMAWLVKQRNAARTRASQLQHKHEKYAAELAEVKLAAKHWLEAIEELKRLRKHHGETAARSSVIGHQLAEEGAISDPTPEQIRAKCEEIRSGWSDKEKETRHWQKSTPVDFDPTKFVF